MPREDPEPDWVVLRPADVRRLLALGASSVDENRPPDADVVTLSGPEAERFDVVQLPQTDQTDDRRS